MSRVAKKPVELVKDVSAEVQGQAVTVKGKKGSLTLKVSNQIEVKVDGNLVKVAARSGGRLLNALAGTTRAHIANMVVGVGYLAAVQGQKLNLTLGFSHPVEYPVPKGITIETPSQNEIIIKGMDRQQVGQVAAELRDYRPPEPYKGKGVKYSDERIVLKEAKKK
jgi:large subunit ribosomal protein L6